MKQLLILLTLGVFAFSITSCKDDEAETEPVNKPTQKTKTQLLTGGKWVTDSGTITPDIIIDIFGVKDTISTYFELLSKAGQGNDCYKDNQLWFLLDSTIVNDEGLTKCDSMAAQQTPGGTWMFIENETKLEVKGNQTFDLLEAGPMTIHELTETKLIVSFEGTNNLSGGAPTKHNLNLIFSNRK